MGVGELAREGRRKDFSPGAPASQQDEHTRPRKAKPTPHAITACPPGESPSRLFWLLAKPNHDCWHSRQSHTTTRPQARQRTCATSWTYPGPENHCISPPTRLGMKRSWDQKKLRFDLHSGSQSMARRLSFLVQAAGRTEPKISCHFVFMRTI